MSVQVDGTWMITGIMHFFFFPSLESFLKGTCSSYHKDLMGIAADMTITSPSPYCWVTAAQPPEQLTQSNGDQRGSGLALTSFLTSAACCLCAATGLDASAGTVDVTLLLPDHADMLSCVVREMICKSSDVVDLSTHISNRG